jgi:hypothetical protein
MVRQSVLCVWNKTNGGMGEFKRSKHELIFVFKHGDARHFVHMAEVFFQNGPANALRTWPNQIQR